MAKAAKMIKVEQTGSAIRRHHSQRSTLIGLKLTRSAAFPNCRTPRKFAA